MSNTIGATSHTAGPRVVEQAAQPTATANRAQIEKEIRTAKAALAKTQSSPTNEVFVTNAIQQQQLTAPGEADLLKQRSPNDEAVLQAQVFSSPAGRGRRTGGLDRRQATGTQPAPRPSRDGMVIKIDTTLDERAKTPEEALSMWADKAARLADKLRAAVKKGKDPFTGNDGEVARRAYLDFLKARGMADTPASRRVFVDLLSERKTRLSNSGHANLGVDGEKQFYADAALARLRARSAGQGPIELAPQDRWMISALSDPNVKLTDADRELRGRTQWLDPGNLRRNLGEWAKQAAASEPQPGVGQAFRVWLNAADVFAGDPQKNAFSMAAKRASDYSDQEIDLGALLLAMRRIGLYVDYNQTGEPLITTPDQAGVVNFGGQDFVPYSMSEEGAKVLQEARYALQSVKSVDLYRMDPIERADLGTIRQRIDNDLEAIRQVYNDRRPLFSPGMSPGESARVTDDYVHRYLDGRMNNGNVSPSQRLANMMTVLGPARMHVVLARMKLVESPESQSSLATLIINKQFTADDAVALARAQADIPLDLYNTGLKNPLARFIKSLPNDQNGTAIKAGYAWGCVAGAHGLAQLSPLSDQNRFSHRNQLAANFNDLCQNATSISAGLPEPFKEKVFSQLRSIASEHPLSGDVLNAYAANILGSLSDKSQIVATLRAMAGRGGVGANGAIDPNSDLAKFLQSALRGQSQFGIASPSSPMTPSGEMPQGVTNLLNAIADSGDTKLMAGTLDTVMQWTIRNPTQAAVLASQDTGTGYRNALTSLLDRSFNQFVALDPLEPNATIVPTMHPQMIADLQSLSAIQMGPPYDGNVAGNFADVFGKHAVQFAAYAQKQARYPELDRLLAGTANRRNSAARIFGGLINGFAAGVNQSQASFRRNTPRDARLVAAQSEMRERVTWDLARAFGTGMLLASGWITGTATVSIGLGAEANWEKLVSIFGRVGLFSGSVGTARLDITNRSAEAEARGLAYAKDVLEKAGGPTHVVLKTFYGWMSKVRQLHGRAGEEILNNVLIGSSFAGAPVIEMNVQNFYEEYDPFGYYLRQTGGFPPISTGESSIR